MKSKKIVALAIAAAMALSISMTAFAAAAVYGDPATTTDYVDDVETKDGDTTIKTQSYGFWVQTGEDAGSKKFHATLPGTEDAGSSTTADGKTTHNYKLSKDQINDKKTGEIVVRFSSIKGLLVEPDTTGENKTFVGWKKTAQAENEISDNAPNGLLKDSDEIEVESTEGKKGAPVKFYPQFKTKSTADVNKEIASLPVLATDKDNKDWKKTDSPVFSTVVTQKKSEEEVSEAAAVIGAAASKCKVYDIKAQVKEKNAEDTTKKDCTLKNGQKADVEISNTEQDKSKLKVFHLDGKGGADEITDFKVDADDEYKIKFKYGDFSNFVVTTDTKAKAPASSDATATSTSTSTSTSTGTGTGTEDAAADAGNVPTGEFSALPVALLAVAALSATGVVAYKKRIAE